MFRNYLIRRTLLLSLLSALLIFTYVNAANAYSITITSPANGATVSGSVAITVNKGVASWADVYIDGAIIGSTPNVPAWNATTVANGTHTISAKAFAQPDTYLGSAYITVDVENGSVQIAAPANGATVSGVVVLSVVKGAGVEWADVYVDGRIIGSTPDTGNYPDWNSATVANGAHTITATGFSSSDAKLGSASIGITVANGTSTPTATPTSTPSPSPTVTPSPSPTASPSVTPTAQPSPTPTSTPSATPTSTASPTPTSTPTPTPSPTPTPIDTAHWYTLPPGATLPSEAQCVSDVMANPSPEVAPWNENDGTGYNNNEPPPNGIPAYFYAYAGYAGANQIFPEADFANVDGDYSGTTDDLVRIAACKWGIDEDVIRAQLTKETHWHEDCAALYGGSTCNDCGDYNNPSGDPSGLPLTAITPNGVFTAIDGIGINNQGVKVIGSNHCDSWGIEQNKVYYQWATWPMIAQSTPFALDYRNAEFRACINGDQYDYFHSQSASAAADYQTFVNAAKTDPSELASAVSISRQWPQPSGMAAGTETALQYVQWGCFATHFCGDWNTGSCTSYLDDGYSDYVNKNWP